MSVISVIDPTLIQKNLCLHVVIVTLQTALSVVTDEHSRPNILASAFTGRKNKPANTPTSNTFVNFKAFIFKKLVCSLLQYAGRKSCTLLKIKILAPELMMNQYNPLGATKANLNNTILIFFLTITYFIILKFNLTRLIYFNLPFDCPK